MTHGHEQWWGDCLREQGALGGGGKSGKIQTTVIAYSIKCNNNNNNKAMFSGFGKLSPKFSRPY